MKTLPVNLKELPGLTSYTEAWNIQKELVLKRLADEIPDTLILTEHEPVITLGRNADAAGVVASEETLGKMGIEVIRVERGGQATYHGPGQIVGYPILKLSDRGMGVAEYVGALERVMSDTALDLGIETQKKGKITGVFTTKGKIGAIGVRIQKGISFHGFAFNRDPNLDHYQLIVPCGMNEIPPCSCAQLIKPAPSANLVKSKLLENFSKVFSAQLLSTNT